jgi:hypothetical protein
MSVQIKIAMKELDVSVNFGGVSGVSYKGEYNLTLNSDDIPAVLGYLKTLGKQIEAVVKDNNTTAVPTPAPVNNTGNGETNGDGNGDIVIVP